MPVACCQISKKAGATKPFGHGSFTFNDNIRAVSGLCGDGLSPQQQWYQEKKQISKISLDEFFELDLSEAPDAWLLDGGAIFKVFLQRLGRGENMARFIGSPGKKNACVFPPLEEHDANFIWRMRKPPPPARAMHMREQVRCVLCLRRRRHRRVACCCCCCCRCCRCSCR